MSTHAPRAARHHAAAGLALALLAWVTPASAEEAAVQLRLRRDEPQAASLGPLAEARALDPGLIAPLHGGWVGEARWRQSLPMGQGLTVSADLAASATKTDGLASRLRARADELLVSHELGAWTVSAGRQVVSWDVGLGFRPNDLVQQERRRTLLEAPLQGRPVLILERFSADGALSLVWTSPGTGSGDLDRVANGKEQALAARLYVRQGNADLHAFGRWGQRTGASLGAATTWVASDAWSLHASGRVLQRHLAWSGPAGSTLFDRDPGALGLQGGAAQGLVGMTWTSTRRWSLLMELWHDGTARSDAQWRTWFDRNDVLAGTAVLGAPARARAAQWAWQADPLDAANLRRISALVRISGEDGPWQWSLDALGHPSDRGRILTAGLSWQGHRTRLTAAWRQYGGPHRALSAQLPQRRSAAIEGAWSF